MATVFAPGLPTASARRGADHFWVLGFLVAATLFLCLDARTQPIVLWDESRNFVNALEMRRTGVSLVTTYDFQPDLWNTKPPLLIWLMTGSMALFGPSEWALRLPTMLAALGTLLLLIQFARRMTGSTATALVAGALLLLSPGFFGEHGARTADYDALLLFFTTAYLQLLFAMVHRRDPCLRLCLLTGSLIGLAVLTKSVAGLVPGAGVTLYLLLTRRWKRPFVHRGYWLMAAAAALPVLIFLAARETAAPGYIQAALDNDVLGRFARSMGGSKPADYYVRELLSGWFFAGPLLLCLPFALGQVRGKSRAVMLYSLAVAAAILAVISLSGTKFIQYSLPAFPALALASAIALRALWRRFWSGRLVAGGRPAPVTVVTLACSVLILGHLGLRAADWRYRIFPERQSYTEARYGELFASLAALGVRQAEALDQSHIHGPTPHYAPLLRGYALLWGERGLIVRRQRQLIAGAGSVWVSCDPPRVAVLRRLGSDIGGVRGCVALRVR